MKTSSENKVHFLISNFDALWHIEIRIGGHFNLNPNNMFATCFHEFWIFEFFFKNLFSFLLKQARIFLMRSKMLLKLFILLSLKETKIHIFREKKSWIRTFGTGEIMLLPMAVLVRSKRQMRRSRSIAIAWLISIYDAIVELIFFINLIYIYCV